jgi:hypothetical protein
LGAGDSSGALPILRRAHDRFEGIREARLLHGISKADLAAAYANLGQYRKAAEFAEDCISIVEGVKRLAYTEAMARMTLACSWGILSREGDSEREFERAEKILRGFPDSGRYLKNLETNRMSVRSLSPGHQTGSLRRWILGIFIIVVAIAVIIYLLKFA